jgi:hypothetical protein
MKTLKEIESVIKSLEHQIEYWEQILMDVIGTEEKTRRVRVEGRIVGLRDALDLVRTLSR